MGARAFQGISAAAYSVILATWQMKPMGHEDSVDVQDRMKR